MINTFIHSRSSLEPPYPTGGLIKVGTTAIWKIPDSAHKSLPPCSAIKVQPANLLFFLEICYGSENRREIFWGLIFSQGIFCGFC